MKKVTKDKNKSSNFIKYKHWLIIPLPIFVYILLNIIPHHIEIIGDFLDPGGEGLRKGHFSGSGKWANYIFYIFLLCFIWNIFVIFRNGKKIISAIAILFWILIFFSTFTGRTYYSASTGSMVKNLHRGVVGFITNEVKSCVLREKYLPSDVTYGYFTKEETDAYVKKNFPPEVMFGNLICSERTAVNVVTATLKTYTDFMSIKNPYFPENNAVRFDGINTSESDRGYINLSSSGSNVIIKTCYGRICTDSAYRLSDTIEIK